MIFHGAHYRDGHELDQPLTTLADAATIATGADEPGFVWIGMVAPTHDELHELRERFGLNELAIEDAVSVHERPKLDAYPETGVLFGVVRAARYDDSREEVQLREVSIFLGQRFVITIRGEADHDLRDVRDRLSRRPDLARLGPSSVLWAMLDALVDDYAPVVDGFEKDVDEIEATVFGGSEASPERIYRLRGQVTDFARAAHPLIGPLDRLRQGSYAQIPQPLLPFFGDVTDHLRLVDDQARAQWSALGEILQANIAVISLRQAEVGNRQNETTRILTIIATVFLPLTFVTGFFGMNFGWMDRRIDSLWVFLVFGVGSLVVSTLVLWGWFQRSSLFAPDE